MGEKKKGGRRRGVVTLGHASRACVLVCVPER